MSWYRMELYIVTAYFGDASIFGDDEDVSRDVGDLWISLFPGTTYTFYRGAFFIVSLIHALRVSDRGE